MPAPLRQKMIEDMQLHGFAARTQEAYLLAMSQLRILLIPGGLILSTIRIFRGAVFQINLDLAVGRNSKQKMFIRQQ